MLTSTRLPVLALGLLAALAGCARAAPPAGARSDGGSSWPASATPAPVEARTPTGPSIKVLTYNMNYGLGGDQAGVEAVAAADADLVLLQETTPAWASALRTTLGERYPHMAFRDCCGAGGMGVLSKRPFVEKDYAHAPAGWFPAWRLVVDSPLGPLQVLNVHLHPQISESGSVVSGHFSTPPIRAAEIAQYHALLDPSLPTLVVGDFNEDHDGGAVGYLIERGFRSALSELAGCQPTWHWRTSLGTVQAEFDHLVHDERLRPLEVHVLPVGRSDHFPLLGVFAAAFPAAPPGTTS
jgi:endonuclease/exonuclease/phosphatase family metal-dependent hydrolase